MVKVDGWVQDTGTGAFWQDLGQLGMGPRGVAGEDVRARESKGVKKQEEAGVQKAGSRSAASRQEHVATERGIVDI
jgi:hypothetical protein